MGWTEVSYGVGVKRRLARLRYIGRIRAVRCLGDRQQRRNSMYGGVRGVFAEGFNRGDVVHVVRHVRGSEAMSPQLYLITLKSGVPMYFTSI